MGDWIIQKGDSEESPFGSRRFSHTARRMRFLSNCFDETAENIQLKAMHGAPLGFHELL